ncbi:MAG: glycosyltransferase [Treponema sp.]|nr:glycosyltransferase [Treponema sp.]
MNTDSNEKVLLSIITINYNNADGLRKTIESVRSQSFSDYEHIIVDGGSSDGSKEVIQESLNDENYSKHISWWCSERDSGIYNAMNKGIDKARGKFVYMLNSGDALLPAVLGKIAPYLDENMDKVVYGPVDSYLDGNFTKTTGMGSGHLPIGMMPHQGIFVPLDLHKKYGVYNENYKICADREFILRLYTNKVSFVHIPVIICNYDEGGISSTSTYAALKETYKLDKTMGMKKKSLLRFIKGLVKLCLGFK